MNMGQQEVSAVTPSERLRRTALVLHALVPADREWVLAQLPKAAGGQLRGLVSELEMLGLPGDRDLVASVIATQMEPTPVEQVSYRVLGDADAASVYECVANQPDRLVAALLSDRSWPWTAGLLSRLGPARAERIREIVRNWKAPSRLQEAVISALALKVEKSDFRARSLREQSDRGAPRKRWWMRLNRRAAP